MNWMFLSLVYASLSCVVGSFQASWSLQFLSVFLIYFTLNGVFYSFNYSTWRRRLQFLFSFFYLLPALALIFYGSQNAVIDQHNVSLIFREPLFFPGIFWRRFGIWGILGLIAATLIVWRFNAAWLSRNFAAKKRKPYELLFNKYIFIFTVLMSILQIRWALGNDPSQIVMRGSYPFFLFGGISVLLFLARSKNKFWKRIAVLVLFAANLAQLSFLHMTTSPLREQFSFEQRFYRHLFGGFFIPIPFNDLGQTEIAHERFKKLPAATKLDYRMLFVLNDAQRWDHLSSNGYPRPSDEALDWFYKKSFNFQAPFTPANFTNTAVPSLMYGKGPDKEAWALKDSLTYWDFFAKNADTFYITSENVNYMNLRLTYESIGQKHIWSTPLQPDFSGDFKKILDRVSFNHVTTHVPALKGNWAGVWQTFASHFPYNVEPEFQRYQPCQNEPETEVEKVRNCYLNAQLYSAHLRSEFFKKLDLEKTVIVLTSDHAEAMGEHGIYSHAVGYFQEIIKVPFNLYIPPRLLAKLPAEAVENLRENTKHVSSSLDYLPTFIDLYQKTTGEKLVENLNEFTGRSLLEKNENRVVYSSHCFPGYRCYSREIVFVSDDYHVFFDPAEGFLRAYDTWKDLEQKNELKVADLDCEKMSRLLRGATQVHPLGLAMKSYYDSLGFCSR